MTAGAGRRAQLPSADWRPLDRVLPDGTSVRFVEEATGEVRVFDCATIDAAPAIQCWMARVLARGITGRTGVRRVTSFMTYVGLLRVFVLSLGGAAAGVRGPRDIQPWHVTAFAERYKGMKTYYGLMVAVRKFLRHDEELHVRTRAALEELEVPKERRGPAADEYDDAEWQQIMTALRHDVRQARDRIRGCRDLLARFRSDQVLEGGERHVAVLADAFERTGDFPREPSGGYVWQLEAYGGKAAAIHRMCLTPREMAAFTLLLTAMTGENFGTVARWPAAHVRPDGDVGLGPRVALVEEVKARRGPEREHMVAPLEDLPDSLARLLGVPDGEERLFRSPLKIYLLLLELTRDSRRIGGHSRAHSGYAAGRRDGASCWIEGARSKHVARWAAEHGFPTAPNAVPGGPPPIDVGRIRRTVIELRRRPTAHTRATMRDIYLLPSRTVQQESRAVVTAALKDEVAKARAVMRIPVLAAEQVAMAAADPRRARAETGLEPEVLERLAEGEQDTGVTACIDHRSGVRSPVGLPCPASFLDCLSCENARALPHQLPVQVVTAQRIAALRAHVDPQVWKARYRPWLAQLEEIIGHYSPAERERARDKASPREHDLVEELLEGRWDLR